MPFSCCLDIPKSSRRFTISASTSTTRWSWQNTRRSIFRRYIRARDDPAPRARYAPFLAPDSRRCPDLLADPVWTPELKQAGPRTSTADIAPSNCQPPAALQAAHWTLRRGFAVAHSNAMRRSRSQRYPSSCQRPARYAEFRTPDSEKRRFPFRQRRWSCWRQSSEFGRFGGDDALASLAVVKDRRIGAKPGSA